MHKIDEILKRDYQAVGDGFEGGLRLRIKPLVNQHNHRYYRDAVSLKEYKISATIGCAPNSDDRSPLEQI